REELPKLDDLGRFDFAAVEQGVTKVSGGYNQLKGILEQARKANETAAAKGGDIDPLERVLTGFLLGADEQIQQLMQTLAKAKQTYVKTAKMFGEDDLSISKTTPEAFFGEVHGFIKKIDNRRRSRQDKIDREARKKGKEGGDSKQSGPATM